MWYSYICIEISSPSLMEESNSQKNLLENVWNVQICRKSHHCWHPTSPLGGAIWLKTFMPGIAWNDLICRKKTISLPITNPQGIQIWGQFTKCFCWEFHEMSAFTEEFIFAYPALYRLARMGLEINSLIFLVGNNIRYPDPHRKLILSYANPNSYFFWTLHEMLRWG